MSESGRPKLRVPALKCGPTNCLLSGGFMTTVQLSTSILAMKRTMCKWQKRFVRYKGSPTFPQNLMNYGSQLTEIAWLIFAHPLQ